MPTLTLTYIDDTGATYKSSLPLELVVAAPAPEPEPAPAPEPAPEPAPAPLSAFPNASNTGVPSGVTLKPSGSLNITTNGAVISGLDIAGTVFIAASNVTLKNCRVKSPAYAVVKVKDGFFATIQDCEINGVGTGNDGSHGIYGQGTFLRNNIYNVENGITLNGGETIIQGNYIHDLKASGSPHYDGIQMDGGQSNVSITRNTIINPHDQTAAIMVDNYFGPISNIKVDGNLLQGGGYTVYSDGQFSGGAISGVSFTNNKFGKGRWGYASIVKNTVAQSGNTDLNGAAIKI
jgi:hypothetical protein